jgi:predicted phosphodiesterase
MLIGDVHTEHERLARVLEHAAASGQRSLCVGDVVDGPGDPLRCIELLEQHGVDTVRGNHERWVAEGRPMEAFDYPRAALAWLAALPVERSYDTPMGRLLLGHGLGADDMAQLRPGDTGYALESNLALHRLLAERRCEIFVGGHTHRRMVRRFDHLLVLNPGTLFRDHDPACMEVDLEARTARVHAVSPDGLRLLETLPLP